MQQQTQIGLPPVENVINLNMEVLIIPKQCTTSIKDIKGKDTTVDNRYS
jgi:hypothetical protein